MNNPKDNPGDAKIWRPSSQNVIPEPRVQANPDTTADAQIISKLSAAHSLQFRQRFPGQVEHCQRLIAERLQQGLRKDAAEIMPAADIQALTAALHTLADLQRNYL